MIVLCVILLRLLLIDYIYGLLLLYRALNDSYPCPIQTNRLLLLTYACEQQMYQYRSVYRSV